MPSLVRGIIDVVVFITSGGFFYFERILFEVDERFVMSFYHVMLC